MSETILVVGAFDVKGEEYAFVKTQIENQGCSTLTMNFGTMGTTDLFPVDFENDEVAKSASADLKKLVDNNDRGKALAAMAIGAAKISLQLLADGKIDGVFGMGGTGGTSVISSAMRALPIGFPKVLISTVASGDTTIITGAKDITMIPSIVDVAGLNPISEKVFKEGVGAICGMVKMDYTPSIKQKPVIAATMFGNTTDCVNMCRESLVGEGFEVLVFHCTGTGGKTMESLVDDGFVSAVLDITTTEWADQICGGVFDAGPDRLSAPGKAGIPHLIVPGCVDMVNFGPISTIPSHYKERNLYEWNPNVTLMRTNVEENAKMGEIFAKKANESKAQVAFLLPLKGVSILDSEGERFWWPEADKAMFDAIKTHLNPDIEVVEIDANINDKEFADTAVNMLKKLMAR